MTYGFAATKDEGLAQKRMTMVSLQKKWVDWELLGLAGTLLALMAVIMSAYAGLLWFVLGGRS